MLIKEDERQYSHDRLHNQPHSDEGKEVVDDWDWPEELWYQLPYGIQVYEHSRFKEQQAWERMTPAKLAAIDERRYNKQLWNNHALAEAELSWPRKDEVFE